MAKNNRKELADFYKSIQGHYPKTEELTDLETNMKMNFFNTLESVSSETRKSPKPPSTREKVADFIRKATPQVATLGPPVPEGMNVRWPKIVSEKLLNFEEATTTDVKIKDLIIKKIGGR